MDYRILVVEDEPGIAHAIGHILGSMGHKAVLADSGQKAKELMAQGAYELLMTDLKLPDADGMEIARHFKDKFPQSQVTVLTGYPSLETAREAIALGVYDYIAKPFELERFKEVIQRCLRAISQEDDFKDKCVLLVEDDSAFMMILKSLCSLHRIPHVAVHGAEGALKCLEEKPAFDVVVSDVGLPGISGFELCGKIKANPKTKKIPVILMTETPVSESLDNKAKKAGADLFISKPQDPYDFLHYVEKFLCQSASAGG